VLQPQSCENTQALGRAKTATAKAANVSNNFFILFLTLLLASARLRDYRPNLRSGTWAEQLPEAQPLE
jgi:hypothetical protein